MKNKEHFGKNLSFISSSPEDDSLSLGVIFLLHGFGANMRDLVDIAPMINQKDFIYIFPNAPFEINSGFNQKAYSWFDFDNLNEIKESEKILENTIEESLGLFNIDKDKIYLGGFSQGGMMTMHADIIHQNLFSGLLILSSTKISQIDLNIDLSINPRVFLAHGVNDSIISINQGQETYRKLISKGLNVEYHEYEMGHQIIEKEIIDIKSWLSE
ncbi:MAG: alpha/beta hydrolase [Dehalococcoidia bacterium]